MLQIERVTLSLAEGEDRLREKAAAILGLPAREIQALTILRRAVDAREEVSLVYTVAAAVKNEAAVLRRCRSKKITRLEPAPVYAPPAPLPAPAVPLTMFCTTSSSWSPRKMEMMAGGAS